MAIEKHPKTGRDRARIYNKGKAVKTSPYFSKKGDAKTYENEWKSKMERACATSLEPTADIQEKLSDFLFTKKSLKEISYHEIERVLQNCVSHSNINFVKDFKLSTINKFLQHKVNIDGLGNSAQRRYTRHLKSFSTFLYNSEVVYSDPLKSLSVPKASKGDDDFRCMTKEELRRVLEAVLKFADYAHPFFFFLAESGCRRSEAFTLEWNNLDFNNRVINIMNKSHLDFTTKSGLSRMIPMTQRLYDFLQELPRTSSFVLVNTKNQPFKDNINRTLTTVLTKIDSKSTDYPELAIDRPLEIHPHTFRHSWVTHMLDAGVPIHRVKAWAGHSSITTTEIYTHMLPDDGQNQNFMSQLDDYRANISPSSLIDVSSTTQE